MVAIVEMRTAHFPYERLHQSCLKKPIAMRTMHTSRHLAGTSLIDTNRFSLIN